MRRKLILDTGIAQTDDQFHATIPVHVERHHVGTAAPGCPPSAARLFSPEKLLLLLLLRLLSLLRWGRGAFLIGLLLALLDNFRLGWSCPCFRRNRFGSSDLFFLHRRHVGYRLVSIRQELQLLRMR